MAFQTYNTDLQVADSAGTATAFLCGEKARYGTLGVNAEAARGDCAGSKGKELQSILNWAQAAGNSTTYSHLFSFCAKIV